MKINTSVTFSRAYFPKLLLSVPFPSITISHCSLQATEISQVQGKQSVSAGLAITTLVSPGQKTVQRISKLEPYLTTYVFDLE